MARPPIMRRHSPAAVALVVLLGLAGAGVLLLVAGVGRDNAAVFGVPLGYQEPPKPGGDWGQALAAACRENDLNESTIEPGTAKLQFTMAPRQCYYRAWLTGTRDSRRLKVYVELTAPDQGEWVLTEWREE